MSTPFDPHQPFDPSRPGQQPYPPQPAAQATPAAGATPTSAQGNPAYVGPDGEASVGGDPAGKPVGHEGSRVTIAERPVFRIGGLPAIIIALALLAYAVSGLVVHDRFGEPTFGPLNVLAFLLAIITFSSLTIVNPGETKVIQFLGNYMGTLRHTGLQMTIPFTSKKRVSVKVHNFETNDLKVNDYDGNPINIAAIIVWQVADTAKSTFVVENHMQFVAVQSESALRHVASSHPYDNAAPGQETLRGSTDLVAQELADEVAARIKVAGLEVLEARIASLAYAPEIAQAMLQRQQAAALISAREKIVEGAVTMVQNALTKLDQEGIVELDDERKAAMVSNLLVVLCSDSRATPVVNAGTLYQ